MDEELWFTKNDIVLLKRLSLIPLPFLLLFPAVAFGAVAIENHYVEQTTEQSINTATFTDVSGMSIPASNFTLNGEYLLYVTVGHFGVQDSNDSPAIRLAHNGTAFEGSTHIEETLNSVVDMKYNWFTVWNNTSNEEITLQISRQGSNAVRFDTMSLIAIRMDGNFTKGTDYFFDERTTDDTLSTSFTTTNPSITIEDTDHATNSTFLILATANLDDNNAGAQHESRIERSGEVNENTNLVSEEGENTSTNKMVQTMMRVIDLGSVNATADNIFETSSQMETGSGTREYSSVFALNLEKFIIHNFTNPADEVLQEDIDWADDVATLEYDLSSLNATSDSYFIAGAIFENCHPNIFFTSRIQVDDVDTPTGHTENTDQLLAHGFDDFADWGGGAKVEDMTATSHTADIDGHADNIHETCEESPDLPRVTEIYYVGFVLELAPTLNTETFDDPISMTDFINATTTQVIYD